MTKTEAISNSINMLTSIHGDKYNVLAVNAVCAVAQLGHHELIFFKLQTHLLRMSTSASEIHVISYFCCLGYSKSRKQKFCD